MTTLSGLEQYAPLESPVTLVRNFLPAPQRLPLFTALESGSWDTLTVPQYGITAKRKTATFYEGDEGAANAYMNKFGDKGIHARPYAQAPLELNTVRETLRQKYGFPFSLCYCNFYKDETTQIGWHQDREEKGSKFPLVMVVIGGTRTFSICTLAVAKARKKDEQSLIAEWQEEAKSGDLVEMPVGFHDNYLHAVLPQKHFAAARISLTFRNPDLSAGGPWAPEHTPRVWDSHAGKEYPADAIYVGCCVRNRQGGVIREGTIFGNGKNPLVSHRPWAAGKESDPPSKNTSAFRTYAQQKMLDPAFRRQAEQLRGKHLLCWCVQDGPKRAKFCHARVWLEVANRKGQQ